ncbi:MAG: SGNH/GDSL hydrolase family protein [Candidatus Roizmanbacteria bacterium]|nr:SGNH/GDSL hydrolase family protein [Candidatus Roizmanbacteria bacterium]
MKKKIFLVLIIFEFSIVIFLFILIFFKKNILSKRLINPINSRSIQKKPTEKLKHFWEPTSNAIEEVHNQWLSYTPKYTINNDALNERFNYDSPKKEKGTFRIITLGDSFTFGENVDTKDNWTEVLEDLLNKGMICSKIKKFEVINLGVSGYDTAYEVERYKIRGAKYKPDIVIMMVIDFMRMTDYRIDNCKISPLKVKELREKWLDIPTENEDKKLEDNTRISYQYPHYERLFQLFQGPLLIVDHEKNAKAKIFFDTLKKKSSKVIYSKTSFPIFEKEKILLDGHPNVDGHKALAKDILESILKNNLISCN